jgi:GNAT superfamily N-acetyltransferase
MSDGFTIRQATLADMGIIVAHRHQMYEDMGLHDPTQHAMMEEHFIPWLRKRLENGRYLEWFAETVDGQVVAGAGMWLQDWPPGYHGWSPFRGYIFNVYTEGDYRRKGLARRMVQAALDWCGANGITKVGLHYSDEGRTVYEAMGFEHSNEMRITVDSGN